MGVGGHASSRAALLAALDAQTRHVLLGVSCRRFACLVPRKDFPLPQDSMERLTPSSLVGRLFFTPAEDDLLLRGCVEHGDGQWATIRAGYLQSKGESALQHRFNQMTSAGDAAGTLDGAGVGAGAGANKFQQYQELCHGYRSRDLSWTLSEDLALLEGFAAHGESWPLINIFFLPQRPVKDLVQRWEHLQRLCVDGGGRGGGGGSGGSGEPDDPTGSSSSGAAAAGLPVEVAAFLRQLQLHGSFALAAAAERTKAERRSRVAAQAAAAGGALASSSASSSSSSSSSSSLL